MLNNSKFTEKREYSIMKKSLENNEDIICELKEPKYKNKPNSRNEKERDESGTMRLKTSCTVINSHRVTPLNERFKNTF